MFELKKLKLNRYRRKIYIDKLFMAFQPVLRHVLNIMYY